MIRIQESKLDSRLEGIFYKPEHEEGEFFDQIQNTDLEKELGEYLVGTIPSQDKEPFDDSVAEELKLYIRNAPAYRGKLFRFEIEIPRNSNLKKNDIVTFRISSWTKSFTAIKEMIDDFWDEPAVLFIVENLVAINVEGYSMFYDQRESLTYGQFSVGVSGSIKIHDKWVKYYELTQIGF